MSQVDPPMQNSVYLESQKFVEASVLGSHYVRIQFEISIEILGTLLLIDISDWLPNGLFARP